MSAQPSEEAVERMAHKLWDRSDGTWNPKQLIGIQQCRKQARYVLSLITPLAEALKGQIAREYALKLCGEKLKSHSIVQSSDEAIKEIETVLAQLAKDGILT